MKQMLQISIGPVQSFISASRKTRDLKAGSELLVEMVRECVRYLLENRCELIFPAIDDVGGLQGADAANVILAITENDPADLSLKCKEKIIAYLENEWEATKRFLEGKGIRSYLDDLARKQIEVFSEFYSAWVAYDESNHSACYEKVSMLLSARKKLRDFKPAPSNGNGKGMPKSPLDTTMESVIGVNRNTWKINNEWQERLLLNPRESLDALSLIKRVRDIRDNRYEGFPSTRKVSVMGLLDTATNSTDDSACSKLVDFCRRASEKAHIDEGDVLHFKEDDLPNDEEIRKEAEKVRKAFLDAYNDGKAPRGYFAVLHADGDSVGKHLTETLSNKDEHKQFSKQLMDFSESVNEIVEANRGKLVFSGGDDVLALLPIEDCVKCASAIRKSFEEIVGTQPTMTVGIGISHIEDDLQECVKFAQSMEKEGKNSGKNVLSLGVRVRSGGEKRVILSWDTNPQEVYDKIIELYLSEDKGEKKIPRGFAFELKELVNEFQYLSKQGINGVSESLYKEYKRICDKKNPNPDPEWQLLPTWTKASNEELKLEEFKRFVDLLEVGHFLTRKGGDV